MNELASNPELSFFRATPEGMMSRPPLCSSLQNLESTFFLIALGRFPHALVMCASAVESAMKAVLNIPPEQFVNAERLFAKAMSSHAALSSFPASQLERFRQTRNRIVHYGFTPQDDEEAATLLLETGFRFLIACYQEFFGFELKRGLDAEVADQLWIAFDVYQRAKLLPGLRASDYFSVFGHLVRTGVRQSLMPRWESEASIHAEEVGIKFNHTEERKGQIERAFGAAWAFNCPICRDVKTLVCELDESALERAAVTVARGECASCGLVVPRGCPFLADAICSRQLLANGRKILEEFGIRG